MRCPICKQEITSEGNPFRPFCSQRCKDIDLDNWLEGRYRIATVPDLDEENMDVESSSEDKGDRD